MPHLNSDGLSQVTQADEGIAMDSSPSEPSSRLTQHAPDTAELDCNPGDLRNPRSSAYQRTVDVDSDNTRPLGQHPRAESFLTATTLEPSEMQRGEGAATVPRLESSRAIELSPMQKPKSKIRLGRETVVTSMGDDDIQALLDTGLWTP